MQRLNAIDAISPAFARTHELLFKPFRIGRSWKLAASFYLALCGSIFVPVPLLAFAIAFLPRNEASARVLALIAVTFYSLVVFLFFYLGARMSFVTFEMLVTRQVFIGPMWRRYGGRVWPWIGLKAAVGTVLSVAMFPVLLSLGQGFFEFVQTMPRVPRGTSPDPAMVQTMFQHIAGLYGGFILFFVVLQLASTLLDDFVKPFFQMEPISLTAAIQRGFTLVTGDFLNCLGYVALKYILAIVGNAMQGIAVQICTIPLAVVAAIAALAGGAMIHHGGAAITAIVILVWVVLGLALLVVLFYVALGAAGYLFMLLEAYSIYFLGGRYPLLGNLLEPGPGGPFTPPPLFPSQEERRNADGGPPMPMNPAVA